MSDEIKDLNDAKKAGRVAGDPWSAAEGVEPPEENESEDKEGRRSSTATRLVELASDTELFHTSDGDGYATVAIGGARATWSLRSKGFRKWLSREFYVAEEKVAGAQALADAIGVLEGKALFEGTERRVFTRVGESEGAIYVDLGSDDWQAVEVTVAGWRVVANAPIKFRRSSGMRALPAPVAGGSVELLRNLVNVRTEEDWKLLLGWLLAAYRPRGPYPVLVFSGEQGSSKTTTALVVRGPVDPNGAPSRSQPREERDLVIAANNSWVVSFDNLSHIEPWQSDALCRLSTGGGFAKRELYSNDDEVIINVQRPVILNGIEELATRSDLLSRALILDLPVIPKERRRSEEEFWREFEEACPRILGALLDAVVVAIRRRPTMVRPKMLPRMADFVMWVEAAAPAFGWEPGEFQRAYEGNIDQGNDLAIDASPVGPTLRKFLADGEWEGTATELLATINERADDQAKRRKGWPSGPKGMAGAVRRLAPNLEAIGIVVEFAPRRRGGEKERLITFRKKPASSVPIVPRGSGGRNPHCSADTSDEDDAGTELTSTMRVRPEASPEVESWIRDGDDGDDREAASTLAEGSSSEVL